MISIIICSTRKNIDVTLKQNIEETIGVIYEIIVIDNSENRYSIFEAYNIGVRKSKFPICCFMHQDILYHTKNWGKNVVEHFKENNVGMIGVAGTKYLSKIPSSWALVPEAQQINILQHEEKIIKHYNAIKENNNVLAIDGVWFCIKKVLFKKISFDTNFSGFHFYDTDISLQIINASKRIVVVKDILIEHFSMGNIDKIWFVNGILFYEKWHKYLPKALYFNSIRREKYELIAAKKYLGLISINKCYKQTLKILYISFVVLKFRFIVLLFSEFRLIFHNTRKCIFYYIKNLFLMSD